MKSVRTLFMSFHNDLGQIPISAFRGAIIEKVGREHTLFHNHQGEYQFHHRYPLIQYKKRGLQPILFCLEEGVDEMYKLFEKKSWDLHILDTKFNLSVNEMRLGSTQLKVNGQLYTYQLSNWQALNERNYKEYHAAVSLTERISILEKVLLGNILSFAKGLDWRIEEQLFVAIQHITPPQPRRFKGTTVMTFNVQFASNILLPDWIGIGKGASIGFGVVKKCKR